MTKVNKNLELKTAINDYCRLKAISKNEFSVQIGVNSAYLSKIEKEKFVGISTAVLTKIWSAIKLRSVTDVFDTADHVSVFRQCDKTRRFKLMTGMIADTGMGKTTSLRAYTMQENVFYVQVDKTMNAKRLLSAILREMRVSFDGNIHEIMLKIAETLNRVENPLLIIDEAGKLNHAMILYLHDLREYTKANCGILLSGMPYFKTNLVKQSDRQKEGYAEFLRRVNIWHELRGLSRKEVEFICQDNGITGQYSAYYGLRFADLMNKILLEQITNKIN
ncbi:MAG: ATP-binding protein [Bacteroidales bacterium]|nr:ATP-binding protein [Bacteroidales bacterium]